jgi:hypothetical protein
MPQLARIFGQMGLEGGSEPAEGPATEEPQSNAVPFRPKKPSYDDGPAPTVRYLDVDQDSDPRPVLLFDLNGVLTTHTERRKKNRLNRPRPGVHHLRRLTALFRVGVFSSATLPTVQAAVHMLEESAASAAGPGPPLFDPRLLLHRTFTRPVPKKRVEAQGREWRPWDTWKPLKLHFSRMHRVVVLDNDAHKAVPGEESNMVLVPGWEEEDPKDEVLPALVDSLMRHMGGLAPEEDVRAVTKKVTLELAGAREAEVAALASS